MNKRHHGADWSDGYSVDTPYSEPIATDLSPTWLSTSAVLHGQPPLGLGSPMTWVELGSGAGLSACMVAATHPEISVWGFDYNPTHVERARNMAAAAGLSNCQFVEASFADLAADPGVGPTQVDVIVVHGVYSWIDAQNQACIASIIEQRLVAGGMAYVMYETPTGWSSMVPLAQALHLYAAADGRRGDLVFHDAASAVTALGNSGARFFPIGPLEADQMALWPTADPFYAAHEYLGANFQPLMFDQVEPLMASAKCSYVGSMNITDQLQHFWAPPELLDLVTSSTDVTVREMLRDLIVQRQLRRDIYRRGLVVSLPELHNAWLRDVRVAWLGKHFDGEPVSVGGGQINLDPKFHGPLVEALSTHDLSVDSVLAVHPKWTFGDAVVALSLLIAGGYGAPALPSGFTQQAWASARAMNQVLVAENRLGANHAALVAPALGAAVGIDPLEMSVVGALWDGAPDDVAVLSEQVFADLNRLGRLVREKGELIRDSDQAALIVERRVLDAIGKHNGVFRRLGVS